MPRAANKVASRRRRKAVLKLAKGHWGSRHRLYTIAKNSVEKALQYQYRDRRQRKRLFRRLWIARINASARLNGTSYSRLMGSLRRANITLNRKALADIAIHDPEAFSRVVQHASA